MADFFDMENNQGGNSPKDKNIQNQQAADVFNDVGNKIQIAQPALQQPQEIDDFFGGGGDQNVEQQKIQQVQQQNNQWGGWGSSEQQTQETKVQQSFPQSQKELDEQEQRRQRLQGEEQERVKKLYEQEQNESTQKKERQDKARQELQEWKRERQQGIEKRKVMNREAEAQLIESRKKNQYKNPWDKIVDNISLKASDYPGKKDVTRMKESILNKKADLSNQK